MLSKEDFESHSKKETFKEFVKFVRSGFKVKNN